jgi:hypothetical protein
VRWNAAAGATPPPPGYWPAGAIVEHLVLFPLRHYADVNRIPPLLPLAAGLAVA